MEAYYKQKQADQIPTKYKNQSEFARLCLYKYVGTDDYGNPQKLKLLGSIVDKGMVYYAFQFNLSELDENATYIGIAGPYKPGATRLNFERYNSYTNYEVKKKSWVKQAKALLPDLKKAYEIK
jgi:hypothetical protein